MNERTALYSASLYAISVEENSAKDVYDSLKLIEKIIEENPDYTALLASSNLKCEEKERLIDEAFEGQIHTFALNFLKILAKKRICDILIPCIKEFEKKYLDDNNIENATIITAIELDEAKKQEIVEKISKSTGKTVNATFSVKEEIIGGIVVEMENSGIDASISGRLQSMRRYINKN